MARADRPNIVFILTDDQAIWAAGCYGNPEIRTPSLDRIAATGVRFENYFVTVPVCSASRATLLTGRIPSQHGVHDFLKGPRALGADPRTFLTDEVCYTDVLAEHGWNCALSGKWHLGSSSLPQHAFSHWFAHPRGAGFYNNHDMIRDGETVTTSGYVTNVITDDALAYIDAHAADESPFYLSVHYTAPHAPWTGHPQDIVDSYDDCAFESCPQEKLHPWAKVPKGSPFAASSGLSDNMGNRESLKGYFAAVTALDLDVGRILDKLEEKGLRGDTLVVFTSDNGYSCGHHGFWGKGNGTSPVNMYENSIKVPFLATHPGVIPEGIVQSAMVSEHDFMPTLLEYVGLPPPDTNLAGISFLAALKDEQASGREQVCVYDEYGSCRMIRTAQWKYVHRYSDHPNELWDLVNDRDERTNLIDDPAQADRIKELRGQMEEWFDRYVEPDKDGLAYHVTGAGQVRPVGNKWEDGTDPFDPAVGQPPLGGRAP
ncbi:MAG: sulfatase-like hydrolase/transferase [Spirochaetaceae bacterium]|nr:sulfatase-like hydrolase/transferase [Spirochaetaceae bacterium]